MEFSNYQNQAKRTAIYPKQAVIDNLLYLGLGLTNEAGEVAGDLKKLIRDDKGILTPERNDKLVDELGDVLWYLAMLCYELETTLESVALRNLAKLRKRQRQNTLHDKDRTE
jgi:NTP pyrophosphatase (non-canonical NTP hydrolase)